MPEASEFDQWEPEDALDSSCPVTAIIPTWRTLTTLDMSHNNISEIDDSVVRSIFNLWKKVLIICGTLCTGRILDLLYCFFWRIFSYTLLVIYSS